MPDDQDHTKWLPNPRYLPSQMEDAAWSANQMSGMLEDNALQRAAEQAQAHSTLIENALRDATRIAQQVSAAQQIEQQTLQARMAVEAAMQAQHDPALTSQIAAIQIILQDQAAILHQARESAAALQIQPPTIDPLASSALQAFKTQASIAEAALQATLNDEKLQVRAAQLQQVDKIADAATQALESSKNAWRAIDDLRNWTRIEANEAIAALDAATRQATGRLGSTPDSSEVRQLNAAIERSLSSIEEETKHLPHDQERAANRSLQFLRHTLVDPAIVEAWLTSPHQDLAGLSPLQVIREGGADAVDDMLHAALEGIPS